MNTCPTCGKQYPPGMRLCPADGAVLEGEAAADDRVGSVIAGKYRLEGFLSRGGMGAVYTATHVMLGKPCVVKIIRPDLVTSPDLVRRFLREARAAAGLSHPNIVVVFDLGESDDGTLYIAMELVQGRSLHDVIRQEGRIQPARTVHLLRQVAGALAVAHRQHIVHRDLKPHNLMVTRDADGREIAKLLDFGIAKTFDENSEHTATGLVLGTPQYMAPEQVMGSAIDHRTDLYALGAILYEMLIGEVPFNARSSAALLMKHVNDLPEPPSRRRPDLRISPALEAVALRCLEKDPARRFQSADEFAGALERALGDEENDAATIRLSRPLQAATPAPLPADAPPPSAVAPIAFDEVAAAPSGARVSGVAPHSTRWRTAALGIAVMVSLGAATWGLGWFRTSAPASGPPPTGEPGKAAPRQTPGPGTPEPTAAGPVATTPPQSGAADTAPPSAPPPAAGASPAAARAPAGPLPEVPSVWVECLGVQEICSPLGLAFGLAIESERLPVADRADGAEIRLTIRATSGQDREQKPGGLMWEQAYTVTVEGRAARFDAVIPMPPRRTLRFDSYFGRDAVVEVGRDMARDAVPLIRTFWNARLPR